MIQSSGRIAVLCPTRNRPAQFVNLAKSIMKTTNRADLVGYVDDDQAELYQATCDRTRTELRSRMSVHHGPRIGPVAACNVLVKEFPGYDAYGLIPDDAVVTTAEWAEWCLDVVAFLPNRVGVISPAHNQGPHVDMPFVTKGWIKATGWFAVPIAYHFVWPLVTALIGEMTAIVHAPKDRFNVDHDLAMSANQVWRTTDTEAFLPFVARELMPIVDRVRDAINGEPIEPTHYLPQPWPTRASEASHR